MSEESRVLTRQGTEYVFNWVPILNVVTLPRVRTALILPGPRSRCSVYLACGRPAREKKQQKFQSKRTYDTNRKYA